MKKLLLIIAGMFMLVQQVYGYGFIHPKNHKEYGLNVYYDSGFDLKINWNLSYKNKDGFYENIRFEPNVKITEDYINKIVPGINNFTKSTYLYILNQDEYNKLYPKRILEKDYIIVKPDFIYSYMNVSSNYLDNGINYIFICYGAETEYSNITVVRKLCSQPYKLIAQKIDYKSFKVFQTEEDYKNYLNNLKNKENKHINIKNKTLDKYIQSKTKGLYNLDKIIKIFKEVYNIDNIKTSIEAKKLKQDLQLDYDKFYKYQLVNEKGIKYIFIGQFLDKDKILYIKELVLNKKIKELENKEHQEKLSKEQYKQEAIGNYGQLQRDYEILQNKYNQLQLMFRQTSENRQKAINLTVALTKIVSKYHTKEKKLAVLDKVDEIIATKYSPDKFKNQDLIGYVKDYLKIIRLAIELSE